MGSNKTQQANVRIIAATHQDLEAHAEEGKFRADLYYRLNVFPIEIPPLRERREDIRTLAGHFVHRYAKELAGEDMGLAEISLQYLEAHDWPGNVRELENAIKRALVLAFVSSEREEDRRLAGPIIPPHRHLHEQLHAAPETRGVRRTTQNENDVASC